MVYFWFLVYGWEVHGPQTMVHEGRFHLLLPAARSYNSFGRRRLAAGRSFL
jgi:hypothetical protein